MDLSLVKLEFAATLLMGSVGTVVAPVALLMGFVARVQAAPLLMGSVGSVVAPVALR